MALFGRKGRLPAGEPSDHRSKRGGARRPTQNIQIDLTDLEKRAAPAPGLAPTPQPGAPVRPKAAGPKIPQSTRRSGRPGRKGTPMGELLVKAGAINTEQLTKALRTQEQKGGLLGRILRAMGACADDDVADALAKQFRFTQVDLATAEPTPESLILVPKEKCRELRLVPFECVGQFICVAMVNVLNRRGLTQVENMAKLKVKGFTTSWPQIQATIDTHYTPEIEACVAKVEEARAAESGQPSMVAKELAAGLAGGAPAPAQPPAEAAPAPQAPTAEAAAPARESARRRKAQDLKASARAKPAKPPAEVQAEQYVSAAEALRSRGRLADALKRLEAGAAAVPDSAKLREMLAEVRAEVERKQAEEAEQRRLVRDCVAQGRAARDAGDLAAALTAFREAARLDPKNKVLHRELSVTQNAIARAKAEEVAHRKAEEEARAAEERRTAEGKARRQAETAELLELANKALEDGDPAAASLRLGDVLAIDPEHAEAKELLGDLEGAGAAGDEVEAALRLAAEDREAGRLDVAERKLRDLAEAHGDREDVKAALEEVLEAVEERRAQEKEEREAEKAKLRKAEEDLRERASAFAEADVDRRRTESVASATASGGIRRLEAGTVDEGSLIVLEVTPEDAHAALSRMLAARFGMGDGDGDEALSKLAVAQEYARNRDDLRKLAEAASAVDAALEDIEEEVLVPDEEELGLELEPAAEPTPPMPDLEEQLDAEAEVLEALPVEEGEEGEEGEEAEGEIVEAEVLEAIPERMEAVQIPEAEFSQMEPDLQPDPIQDWYQTHEAGGPVPAAPADD